MATKGPTGMTEQEYLEKLIKWIKERRNQFDRDNPEWIILDNVLDDLREAHATGSPPWEVDRWRMS